MQTEGTITNKEMIASSSHPYIFPSGSRYLHWLENQILRVCNIAFPNEHFPGITTNHDQVTALDKKLDKCTYK